MKAGKFQSMKQIVLWKTELLHSSIFTAITCCCAISVFDFQKTKRNHISIFISKSTRLFRILLFTMAFLSPRFALFAQAPANDLCTSPVTLTSGTACSTTPGTLANATASSPSIAGSCGTQGADVWYQFTAQTAYPTIKLSSIGSNIRTNTAYLQILSGSCGSFTNLNCTSGTSSTLSLTTTSINGGAGLTPGTTYYVRVYTKTAAPSGSNWTFNICITDPSATSTIEFSRAYINVSKSNGGGTINPGDTLEIRSTLVVKAGTVDSLALYDTVYNGSGFTYLPGSLALRTNEGIVYEAMTDTYDSDNGWVSSVGSDKAIQINYGAGANYANRGKLSNTSRPSFYSSTCIMMITYRVVVTGSYGTLINFRTGRMTARDQGTGIITNQTFIPDNLVVYSSPGLCPNAVSPINAIGVESNGTFGTASNPSPLARNRGASAYVPSYIYTNFTSSGGPQDYYYAIANNTSTNFTTSQTWGKPDGSSPSHRLFGYWDIIGDHTGATNTSKGNPPCDTTKPMSSANPCGYMLLVNSAYKTDTVFQYTVTNLCPNTYYEISAWFRNVCAKCSCDSLGNGVYSGTTPNASYRAATPGDSSGVKPNIAFDVDGVDYYSTGNISYVGTQTNGLDSNNVWVKRGFTYLTGATQTSFKLTLRNSAPGGGGNDWALDDIAVATCSPSMLYSPSNNPTVCKSNTITITDTITSYFNNYTYYKWQRSTDGGATWTDKTAVVGPVSPYSTSGGWQYVTSYSVPPSDAGLGNNGDLYRVVVATTSSNLSDASCSISDAIKIITLNVIDCGTPLNVRLISFTGNAVSGKTTLTWSTSQENEPLTFNVEKSYDGINFSTIATVSGHGDFNAPINLYSYNDPEQLTRSAYYRIKMKNENTIIAMSRVVQVSLSPFTFSFVSVINPFNSSLVFDLTSDQSGKADMELVDQLGKTVMKKSLEINSGINHTELYNTDILPAGIYVLRIQLGDAVLQKKVLKQRL